MKAPQSLKIAWLLGALLLQPATSGAQIPAITNQPASQTVWGGGNITFKVGLSGTGPFRYQWQLNSTNLPNIISTVAGNTNQAYSGDGSAATNASMNNPSGVAMDAVGNLFIADYNNNRIRKMDTNGIITTVAGNGSKGYSGDGGAATNAGLNNPRSVAVDAAGNLFIADYFNKRIRKVGANGIITTVAGNGTVGYSGDGSFATNGSLNFPSGVAVDAAGNLFIADSNNHRIRMVNTTGIITTIAGNGTYGYSGNGGPATNANLYLPVDVAVNAAGNVFIADNNNNCVREVDTNGVITTVAGIGTQLGYSGDGGPATNANLFHPFGVTVDSYGNLFIADSNVNNNHRVRMVDANGIITTVAGNGTKGYSGDGGLATKASLNFPHSVAVDASGNLFIADYNNNCIRQVTSRQATLALTNVTVADAGNYQVVVTGYGGSVTSSVATLTVGTVSIQPASRAYVKGTTVTLSAIVGSLPPLGYQWQKNGIDLTDGGNPSGSTADTLTLSNVQYADVASYTVVVSNNVAGSVTSSPAMLMVIATPLAGQAVWVGSTVALAPVSGTGPFTYQWQLNSTNLSDIITTVAGNGSVNLASNEGDGGLAINANLIAPHDMVVNASGNLFIADTDGQRIRKVDTNGVITTFAGTGAYGFSGDGGPATNAALGTPTGVFLDTSGNMFIADSNNQRIREVNTNGIITTVAGNGTAGFSGDGGPATNASLSNPQIMTVDASGNLFIADTLNQRVRKVDTNGIITTFAGKGSTTFSGDGGAATNAGVHRPWGVVEDASGNVFIADAENNRVRKVTPNGIITTVAGSGTTLGYSGDGGLATNAVLHAPTSLILDASGNLIFCDFGNNRVREVDSNGIITTVAGSGIQSFSGDGGAATNAAFNDPFGVAVDAFGNLFIADYKNNRIRKVTNTRRSSLSLINVTAANAGNYQLVVTGLGGSVTSSVVNLIVATSPLIYQTALNSNGSFALNFVSKPASTNVVLCATNLLPPVAWLSIWTNLAGANGDWRFTDTNTAAYPTKFYRSLTQ